MIRIVGLEHGYTNGADIVERIRFARPDVLLVGLGNPLQERWIDDHLEALDVPVAIGVGALFDYLGRSPRSRAGCAACAANGSFAWSSSRADCGGDI